MHQLGFFSRVILPFTICRVAVCAGWAAVVFGLSFLLGLSAALLRLRAGCSGCAAWLGAVSAFSVFRLPETLAAALPFSLFLPLRLRRFFFGCFVFRLLLLLVFLFGFAAFGWLFAAG